MFEMDGSVLQRYSGDDEIVVVPEGTMSIGLQAFLNCRNIKELILPDSLKSIGEHALSGCSSLESLILPANIEIIGTCAFAGCSALREISIPPRVTWIGTGTFRDCTALMKITLPGVSRISNDAFLGCTDALLRYMCRFPVVLNKFEAFPNESGTIVDAFLADKLSELRAKQALVPTEVLELREQSEAQICFYLLRRMIRCNEPSLYADMSFLINIPQVKAILHQSVLGGMANELLHIAQQTPNWHAITLLLSIPAVRALNQAQAIPNTSVRQNLQRLARDKESSMIALSENEARRLKRVLAHYNPLIETLGGCLAVIDKLRKDLKERYQLQPAILLRDDSTHLVLPFDWQGEDGFEAILRNLSEDEKQRAKEAYHANRAHTADRYLRKPNPWMAPDALFVCANASRTELWSRFKEHESLIALMYVAATDKMMPALDGHTVETRFDHFIEEMWHIARAHNWDGETAEGANYHNLRQGDKPSCSKGAETRLFQSVIGHEMLQMLTKNKLEQELHDFVRGFFGQKIKINDKKFAKLLYEACERLFIELTPIEGDEQLLAELNIPRAEQTSFIASLQNKYGEELLDDDFLSYLHTRMNLEENKEPHAVRFAIPVSLIALLEKKMNEITSPGVSACATTFFNDANSMSEPESKKMCLEPKAVLG